MQQGSNGTVERRGGRKAADLLGMPEVRVAGYAAVISVWPGVREWLDRPPQSVQEQVARMAVSTTDWYTVMPQGMYIPLQTITVGIEVGIMAPTPAAQEALEQLAIMVRATTAAMGLSIGLRGGHAMAQTGLNLIATLEDAEVGVSSWDPSVGREVDALAAAVEEWVDAGMQQATEHLERYQALVTGLAEATDADTLLRLRLGQIGQSGGGCDD